MNPYLPEYEYIPDGEPHVFGERVYIFGSHDRFGGEKFCMNDYVAYSAPLDNLTAWRYEGVIYRRDQDPRTLDGSHQLWAPDVAQGKDGRYYLYYCPDGDGQAIGVAVCDEPAGHYQFYGIVHDREGQNLGERPLDTHPFDPAVFVDDDGEVYLYSGNGFLMKNLPPEYEKFMPPAEKKASIVVRLEDDMLTMKTEPVRLIPHVKQADGTDFEKHPFFEASSMRKIRGNYYLIYSSNKMHELCYAISTRPDGDFRFGGVLISNVEIHENSAEDYARNNIGNNHGSIVEIEGAYYLFYHRQTTLEGNSRQGCAERIEIMPDGSIPQVSLSSNGMEKPFNRKGRYSASLACHVYRDDIHTDNVLTQKRLSRPYLTQDGADHGAEDAGTAPQQFVANIQEHSVVVFRYFDTTIDGISITVRGDGSGRFILRAEPNQKGFATIPVRPCEDWTSFCVKLPADYPLRTLCLCYEGPGTEELLAFDLQ